MIEQDLQYITNSDYLIDMRYQRKAIVFLALIGCILGCGDSFLDSEDGPAPETINFPPLTVEEIEDDFSELTVNTGINDFSLHIANNQSWDFRLIAPELNADELVPLFVHLHGGALTPRDDAHKGTACLIEPAIEGMQAYILSPNSNGLLWYDAANESQVVNLVNFAIKYLNVDPNRVVVVGYSDGGNGSWFFSDTHPELFSAGIPMAVAYGLRYENGILIRTEIPLYVIQGELDSLFPFTNTETAVELSVAAGSDITLIKAIGLGHFVPCEYLPYLEDAIAWLNTYVWE